METTTSSITVDKIEDLQVIYYDHQVNGLAGMVVITSGEHNVVYIHFTTARALEDFEARFLDVIPDDRRTGPICPECKAPCDVVGVDDSVGPETSTARVSDCCDAVMS